MKRFVLLTVCVMVCMIFLSGCGSGADEAVNKENSSDGAAAKEESGTASEAANGESSTAAEETNNKESLAKRLCGKYSCHIDKGDPGEAEAYILNMITFGDNLYAFCGQAMEDDPGSLEAYSFWACEFIPDVAEALKSKESDRAEVTALNFSIMSNLGKYWDSGAKGTITITDEGLEFTGFDNDGFLVPEHSSTRTFLRDDRVEEVFPYLNKEIREGDNILQGVWVLEGKAVPVYLQADGSNFLIYKKSPENEVYFAAGGCESDGSNFTCRANVFGCGGIPDEWSGNYKVDGDKLYLSIVGETLPEELSGEVVLDRVKEDDIHVTTMDEVQFNEESFGYYGAGTGSYEYRYENGFYGVWTSAVKEREKAVEEAKKLNDLGSTRSCRRCPGSEEQGEIRRRKI